MSNLPGSSVYLGKKKSLGIIIKKRNRAAVSLFCPTRSQFAYNSEMQAIQESSLIQVYIICICWLSILTLNNNWQRKWLATTREWPDRKGSPKDFEVPDSSLDIHSG